MTSLYPGTLFYTPGLNRRSTPTKAGTTSDELAKRYTRLPYNGRPWPAPSPVAGVYDISNSSTQLIMMNNKVRKKSKLRGCNDPIQESERIPNPDRHSRSSTPVNKEFHTNCLNSQSPRYTPSVCSELEWANNSQRSPSKFYDGSPVNPKRHTSCRVPTDPTAFQIGMLTETPRRSSSRLSLPARFQSSPLLTHPELKPGERAYLTHIARIYSAGQMMKLKQAQYNQLLFNEMEKGLYGRDEVERYGRFINMGQNRQYQMMRPTTGFRRVMSAPPQKYHVYDSNTYSNNEDSFSTEQSSDLKNSSREEKEGKRPKTGAPRSTRERQLSPRSRTTQVYKASQEIPPTNKESANKPHVKAKRSKGSNRKEESSATTSSDSSSDNNRPAEGSSSHREGVDRPKSRLGHASVKAAAAEQKRSESESSGKENPSDTSTTYQKVPPSSPRDEPSQSNSAPTYENKRLTPVLENQTSSEQNESSDSSNVRKDDSNASSDESKRQQRSSSESQQMSSDDSKVQQRSSDDSEGQQRSSDDSEGQQRSSDDSKGQQRSSDDSEGQQRSSDDSKAQQRSSDDSEGQQRSSDDSESQQRPLSDEDKGQFKSSQDESTGQDTSAAEDYSREDEHNTKSDYTTSEETQLTKSTTENTYTSQTTQEKSEATSSSATQAVSPRDESTNDDTYTMTYDSSATNQPTDNTASDLRHLSTEKSSSAEDKTTTNYTDDSKVQQPRRDSLELDDLDHPRRVNKDVDTIEY